MMEEEEETCQRMRMDDPWTWTMGWRLTVGVIIGLSQGGQTGKYWENCNIIIMKI